MTSVSLPRVAFIGYGEAGGILAADLASRGIAVKAYDLLVADPEAGQRLVEKARMAGVELCRTLDAALADTDLVFSTVTAGSALEVATQAGMHLKPGQCFLDLNSVAPATKKAGESAVTRGGGAYLDVAVMAPVPPQRLATPLLLGGTDAAALAKTLGELGFNVKVVAEEVGVASAIKMCRSVMIKGLEALTTECLSAARHYGAEERVLASLHASFPHMGWDARQPHYLISRVAEHGRRRSEEMEEVAKTVADAGLEPRMSLAISAAQRDLVERMADLDIPYAEPFDWKGLIDRLARH